MYAFISIAAGTLVIAGTIFYFFCRIFWYFCCNWREKRKTSHFDHKLRVIANSIMMTSFFAFLAVMLILCYSLGVQKAFGSISEAVDAPYGVAQIAYHFSLATQPLFIGLVSTVVLPTLRNVNSTISDAINWEAIINDFKEIDAIVDRLPNLHDIRSSINIIDANITTLNNSFSIISNYGDYFEDREAAVHRATVVLQSDMRQLNSSLVRLSGDVDNINNTVEIIATDYDLLFGVDGPENYTPSDRDGYVDYVQYDIAHLARDDTPGEGVPTIATLDDAARGPTASVQRLLNGNLNGQRTELLALNAKLHNIYASVVLLPNFAETATVLEQINDLILDMVQLGGVIAVMPGQLIALQSSLDNLPNTTIISNHAITFYNAVNKLNSVSLVSELKNSKALVRSISDELGEIIDETNRILDIIKDIRAPLYDLMVIQPRGFNKTIYENPYDLTDTFITINNTITKVTGEGDRVQPYINTARKALANDIDVDEYILIVEDAQNDADDITLSINRTEFLNTIAAVDMNITYNMTLYLSLVSNLNESLSEATVSSEFINKLRYLEDLRSQLESSLHTLVAQVGDTKSDGSTVAREGDYWRLTKGVCSDDTTVYCEADADCGGTCSSIAVYRCSPNGDGAYPVTPCVLDSQCDAATTAGTVTSRCLADNVRATALQVGLDALADPSTTQLDQDAVENAFTALRDAAAQFDVDTLSAELHHIRSTINAGNTWTYELALQDVINQLEDDEQTVFDFFRDVKIARRKVDSINLDEYNDGLGDIQDQIDEYGDKLTEYIGFAEDLQTYMFHSDGLKSRFSVGERGLRASAHVHRTDHRGRHRRRAGDHGQQLLPRGPHRDHEIHAQSRDVHGQSHGEREGGLLRPVHCGLAVLFDADVE